MPIIAVRWALPEETVRGQNWQLVDVVRRLQVGGISATKRLAAIAQDAAFFFFSLSIGSCCISDS